MIRDIFATPLFVAAMMIGMFAAAVGTCAGFAWWMN
jgi:hypothetical protein